jgi:hypothetical protein
MPAPKGNRNGVTHGGAGRVNGKLTREYAAYISARYRCNKPNNKDWHKYGGRGIRFLFTSFPQFLKDVGAKPTAVDAKGRAIYSLDRKDNNGHYAPGNVRWATRAEQDANKRAPSEYTAPPESGQCQQAAQTS